jgi:hypothetical protein
MSCGFGGFDDECNKAMCIRGCVDFCDKPGNAWAGSFDRLCAAGVMYY